MKPLGTRVLSSPIDYRLRKYPVLGEKEGNISWASSQDQFKQRHNLAHQAPLKISFLWILDVLQTRIVLFVLRAVRLRQRQDRSWVLWHIPHFGKTWLLRFESRFPFLIGLATGKYHVAVWVLNRCLWTTSRKFQFHSEQYAFLPLYHNTSTERYALPLSTQPP